MQVLPQTSGWDLYFEEAALQVWLSEAMFVNSQFSFLILCKHLLTIFPFHATPNWHFESLSKLFYWEIQVNTYSNPYRDVEDKKVLF